MKMELLQKVDEIDAARLFVHHMNLALVFFEATDLPTAQAAIDDLAHDDERFILVRAFANALQAYYDNLERVEEQ